MKHNTPIFPEMRHFFRRPRRNRQQMYEDELKRIQEKEPGELSKIFGDVLSPESIPLAEGTKERVFDTRTTFYAMLNQTIKGGSLRSAVAEVQATRKTANLSPISNNTAAYSKARGRLPDELIEEINERVLRKMDKIIAPKRDRRVLALDGSSMQLADTPDNQFDYPQSSTQNPGCGWPIMLQTSLVDLDTGAIVGMEDYCLHEDECSWFQVDLIHEVEKGDILIGDRGFCSFLNTALSIQKGAGVVFRLHQARKVDWQEGQTEQLVTWHKPPFRQMPQHIFEDQYNELADSIEVRYVRFNYTDREGAPKEIVLVTTLKDTSVAELAQLYHRRWDIELAFHNLKTFLGMKWLPCKTPQMCRKQMKMHLLAYNLIRYLMLQASLDTSHPPRHLSFKGSLDRLICLLGKLGKVKQKNLRRFLQLLFHSIGSDPVPRRPGRSEPRRIKCRPQYSFLTKRRQLYANG